MAKGAEGVRVEDQVDRNVPGGTPGQAQIDRLESRCTALEELIVDFVAELAGRTYLAEVALGMRSSAQVRITGTDGLTFGVMGATRGSFDLAVRNYRAELVKALGRKTGDGSDS